MIRKKRPFFRAVLFDMDGVIVDSMPYHFISWYEALRPRGVRVSCSFIYEKEGEKWEKTLGELLRGKKGFSRSMLQAVFRDKQRIFRRYFRRFIFDGAFGLLETLRRQGVRTGLVTSTPSKEIDLILPATLLALFDTVVAGDMVGRGKPFPDPYLKAASLLDVPPGHCAVVENAVLGIRSAKAAGMYCCALTTSLSRERLENAKPDAVADTLGEVLTLLERAFKRR